MDMNTVPTDSLLKMFNLATRAHAAGIAEDFRRAFARDKILCFG
jgi:hypothetical protein